MLLNDTQQQSLKRICDTLVPRIESNKSAEIDRDTTAWQALLHHEASGSEPDRHFIRRLETAKPHEIRSTKRLLSLIETPLLCFPVTGFWRPFSSLHLDQRVQVLRRWATHRRPEIRKFFQSVKRLTMFLSYAKTDDTGQNASWPSLRYEGNNQLENAAPDDQISIAEIPSSGQVDCDVLIIGSGAGGSVAAAELAAAGLDCLIAEKGSYIQRADLGQGEFWGNRTLFDKYGALSTDDLAVVILSGSTVGGGTTVNWMTCLEPGQQVRQQWSDLYGLTAAIDGRLQASFDAVQTELGVNREQTTDNPQNAKLRLGCEQLGYRHATIPRNASNCGDCGFCGYGCRSPGKQDSRRNFLRRAATHGARVMAGLELDRLNVSGDRVVGAEGWARQPDGTSRQISIRCNSVVCAAGSIHTPALLMRSGLSHPQLGSNLFLHPTTAIAAYYDEPIQAWSGQPQTVVCDQFEDLDGSGYGVRFETAPLHPGFGAMALAWDNPVQHKRMMFHLSQMANTIVLCRDGQGGRVAIDAAGQPIVKYRLDPRSAEFLLEGSIEATRIHRAAGAHTVVGPHQELCFLTDGNRFLAGQPGECRKIDDFERALRRLGARPNHLSLFSAHQMSTCRMSAHQETGCLTLEGRWRGIPNLWVCDGSILPTSCGVNPMITIMGLSHWVAQHMKAELI